jgi:hypothetical protein
MSRPFSSRVWRRRSQGRLSADYVAVSVTVVASDYNQDLSCSRTVIEGSRYPHFKKGGRIRLMALGS